MSPSFSMSSNFHSFDFSVRLRISKKDLHCSGIKCKTKSSAVIKLLLCLPHNTPQRIKKGITLFKLFPLNPVIISAKIGWIFY